MTYPLFFINPPDRMIEFQYFNGCPHALVTLRNLRKVMAEMDIGEDDPNSVHQGKTACVKMRNHYKEGVFHVVKPL